jgi:N6-adenosine-specific RNA methylase IME4
MSPRYRTLLADPPWRAHSGRLTGRRGFADAGRGAVNRPLPYPTMTVAQIACLPVAGLAADEGSHLWLWTTNGYVEAAFGVVKAWGFKFSTLHTWCKSPMGGGLGESFGITTEFLLFARRGRAPMRNRTVGTWHTWKRRYVDGAPAHSTKPEEAYALIEHASHGPFVELFSREDQPRLGWSYWGNESLGTAEFRACGGK